jgi:hypothetical protein
MEVRSTPARVKSFPNLGLASVIREGVQLFSGYFAGNDFPL